VSRRLATLAVLVLASVASVALVVARDPRTGDVNFRFLVWNLALAWIPFLLALAAYAYARRPWTIAALGVGWLLFFPNAPYIVTDFIHLQRDPFSPLWYDALTIAASAATGLALGFTSLYLMQCVVRREAGAVAGWLVVGAACGLGSFGVYLGRFLRANSWDALTRPEWFARLAHARMQDPFGNPRLIVVTVGFTLLLTLGYATLYALAAPRLDRR
jgi:uncharacterized membrane protein